MDEKVCTVCGVTKPLNKFNKGNAKYGKKSECKICQRERGKEYKQRSEVITKDRKWQRERYWKRSLEERTEIYLQRKSYVEGWMKDNPERCLASRKVRSVRRQKRMKDAGPLHLSSVDLVISYNKLLFSSATSYHCEYCKEEIHDCSTFHLEHIIPISKGGTNETHNLAISCGNCNARKLAKLVEEFRPDMVDYFKNRNLC